MPTNLPRTQEVEKVKVFERMDGRIQLEAYRPKLLNQQRDKMIVSLIIGRAESVSLLKSLHKYINFK